MDNQFELETAIISIHNIADDIELLAEAVLEQNMQPEDIANVLAGIAALTHLRADKAFDAFKAAYNLDEYSDNSVTAAS